MVTASSFGVDMLLECANFYCRVERHSITRQGQQLLSMVCTYPRSILPEFNTHCVISKNTSSSRAIPYSRPADKKRLPTQPPSMREMVMESPYYPIYWGRKESGMQATAELSAEEISRARGELHEARLHMVEVCDRLWDIGMAKQDINRYLEPWGWTTQILTATEWNNFWALRTHKDAHPAFRYIARKMYVMARRSQPTLLREGEWHLPFIGEEDRKEWRLEDLKRISVARCARLSYNTFDGVRDAMKDFELYDRLCGQYPKHMSPFAHQGRPKTRLDTANSNFYGFHQFRKDIAGENIMTFEPTEAELLEWELY